MVDSFDMGKDQEPRDGQKLSRQQRRALEREAKKFEKRQPNNTLDNQVIAQEARRLGIKPSSREQALWTPYETIYPDSPLPPNYQELVSVKLATTLALMETSENPYLNQAAGYI